MRKILKVLGITLAIIGFLGIFKVARYMDSSIDDVRWIKFRVLDVDTSDFRLPALILTEDGNYWRVFNEHFKENNTYIGRFYTFGTEDVTDDEYLDYLGEEYDDILHYFGCPDDSRSAGDFLQH